MKDYHTLFQCSPYSNLVYDLESGKIIEANEAALGLYGYDREEFLGLTINEVVLDRDIRQSLISNKEVKQYHQFHSVKIKTKSGTSINIELFCQKLVFQQRNCIMVAARSLGHRHEMDLSQKVGQSMKNSKTSNVGYWKYIPENETLSISDEVFSIWGRNRDELSLTIENIISYLPKGDRELFYDNMSALFHEQKELDFVHRILLPDGSTRWLQEQGKLIRNSNEQPEFFEGVVKYITDYRLEEQQFKLLESVVTHTNDAVMITEANPLHEPGPRITYVNQAFTRMTGYAPKEVIGRSPRFLQGPESDKKELEKLGRALKNYESYEITTVNYKKNGVPFWVNFSVSPVEDDTGNISHFIAIQRDVSSKINTQVEKDFLTSISSAFKEKEDLGVILQHICKLVAVYGKFSFCEVWLPSLDKSCLYVSARFGKDITGETFYKYSKEIKEMGYGEGLSGTVWKGKKPVLWGNIGQNNLFVRKEAAKHSGIKAVLGIPLKHQESIVGVLVAGTLQNEKQIKTYYPVLSKLEDYLGSEINRKRLEVDLMYLFETLPDLICLFDLRGNFLKINRAGCDILGYTESEIVGAEFGKFIHAEDREISDKLLQKIRDGQDTFQLENRYITNTGNLVWLSWHCKVVLDEGIVYATAKNITESKKLQEVVSDATRLARIGGWEIDMINGKLTWSEGVHQIYETDPDTYIPELEHAINFYREDHRERVTNAVNLAMETGAPFDYEAALISAKGHEKWVRAKGQADMVNGKCIRLFGSFQDITYLKETEHRLQTISNDLPGVTFQYYMYPDGTDQLVSVSQKSEEIWNLSPEKCEEHSQLIWDQIKKGGDFELLKQNIQESAENLTQWHSRWRYVLPNGKIRWHEGFGTPHKLADGTLLFNSMIFDITEEVKLSKLHEDTSQLSQIGSWEMDLLTEADTDAMYWSPIVRNIIGVDEDYDASLSGGLEFYTPESRPIVEKAIAELIENGTEYDKEVLLTTRSGKQKWVRIIGKSEGVDGICSKIFGSIQDIHSMKSTQLQLQEILGSISDAFYAVDKDWNFTFFNKEAENLLGKQSGEVLGKNLWELFIPTLGTELETVYKRVAKKGKAESFEYLYPGNGSWYEINTYPSNGGVSVYFKNIDERKKAEAALERAYQEKNGILESIGDAFFAMKEDFTVTYWNKTAERLLRVKGKTLSGRTFGRCSPMR